MTLYSRKSSVNLGAFVVRHTLSLGGGYIKHMGSTNAPEPTLEWSDLERVQAGNPTYRTEDPHLSHGTDR
jgi:hypothetical protein